VWLQIARLATDRRGRGWRREEMIRSPGLRAVACPLSSDSCLLIPRKEVIQPHLPIRLPCYDFTPVMNPTVVNGPPQFAPRVSLPTSGKTHSHGVTGGVYKTRERIHRGMLIRDY
jgi:hypothetical protein